MVAPSLASRWNLARLTQRLELELNAPGLLPQETLHYVVRLAPAPGGLQVVVEFDGEQRRQLIVDEVEGDERGGQDRGDRERTLALIIGELSRAPRARSETVPSAPPPRPTVPRPVRAAERAPQKSLMAERSTILVGIEAGVLRAFGSGRTVPELQLIAAWFVTPRFLLRTDLSGLTDRSRGALGQARLDAVLLGVSLARRFEYAGMAIDAGPLLRGGWALGRGEPSAASVASSSSSPVALVGGSAGFRFPASSKVFAMLDGEATYAVGGVALKVDDQRVLGIVSVSAGLVAGCGIVF